MNFVRNEFEHSGTATSVPVGSDLYPARIALVRADQRSERLAFCMPEAAALLAVIAWMAVYRGGPVINDVGWQLWVGQRVNDGARLYVDILEVNPPLWFWFAAMIQSAARLAHVSGQTMLLASFGACAASSILLVRQLLPTEPRARAMIHAGLILTLFLTSSFALGQREQFTFITMVPYVALIAARAENRPVRWGLAVAIGLFAAAGFALKHYFAIIPIALEAWLLWRRRRMTFRPELAVLALAAAGYVAAIMVFAPEYLTVMVPLNLLAYDGYGAPPLVGQLRQPALFAGVAAALALWMRRRELPVTAGAFAIAIAACATAYLLQGKGFDYHAIPTLGCALIGLLLGFGTAKVRLRFDLGLIAGSLALVGAILAPVTAGPARYDGAAAAATARLAPGDSIIVLSASGVAAWPLVQERGLGWPSRHMTLWMLVPIWDALERRQLEGPLEALSRSLTAEIAADLRCARPTLVLIDSRYDDLAGPGGVYGFFSRDDEFVRAMRDYEPGPDSQYLHVYRRKAGASVSDCVRR